MSNLIFILYGICLLCMCDAYKVLLVFSMHGKSHSILGFGMAKHLLKAGHEVTYITSFPEDFSHPKLRQIDVSSNSAVLATGSLNLKTILDGKKNATDHSSIHTVMNAMEKFTYQHEDVSKLLNDPSQQFDVVVAEWMFTELGAGYSAIFNAPLIWFSSIQTHWMVTRLVDEALHPAYNGDPIGNAIPPFDFFGRVHSLWTQLRILYQFDKYGDEDDFWSKVIEPIIKKRGLEPPSFKDVQFNASLIFSNSHVSYAPGLRLPQNYKAIGGFHVQEDIKPLPADLKKIMDDSPHGVIYFSMGSNLKSKEMPDELKKSLIKLFSTLKYTIIWKFEEEFSGLPKNVHVVKWAPQQSVLAHSNCKLFITHGGLLSTIESVHFNVPIIVIPVFGDQFVNADTAVRKGFAKRVDISYSLAEELKGAIEEMFANPSYKEKVNEASLIYHDRPVSPGAELVHWVEHVVKTKGAVHLRSPALHVPLYQKLYLDLLAVILIITIVIWKNCTLFSSKKVNNRKKRN